MKKPPPEPRKGMPSPRLNEGEFRHRFFQQFSDPAFKKVPAELDRIASIAWEGYCRKAPRTRKAGPGFADPDYDLATIGSLLARR